MTQKRKRTVETWCDGCTSLAIVCTQAVILFCIFSVTHSVVTPTKWDRNSVSFECKFVAVTLVALDPTKNSSFLAGLGGAPVLRCHRQCHELRSQVDQDDNGKALHSFFQNSIGTRVKPVYFFFKCWLWNALSWSKWSEERHPNLWNCLLICCLQKTNEKLLASTDCLQPSGNWRRWQTVPGQQEAQVPRTELARRAGEFVSLVSRSALFGVLWFEHFVSRSPTVQLVFESVATLFSVYLVEMERQLSLNQRTLLCVWRTRTLISWQIFIIEISD